MRLLLPLLAAAFAQSAAFAQPSASSAAAPSSATPVYELRIYTAADGKLDELLERFRRHTCALFAKHGMENIAYWIPADRAKDGDKLYYFLRHRSRAAARDSWQAFGRDPAWQAVRSATESRGRIVNSVESIYLATTDYSPDWPAPATGFAPDRFFELRIYTTAENKLPDLDSRFRHHTIALFTKHGMTNLPYFHPTDPDKGAAHTLIYLLAHTDRAAAEKSFADFRHDPDWIRVRTESEKPGPILVPNGVKSTYLVPTDFSSLR